MLTISLEGMQFHAKIGVLPEEKILGNELVIDVHIKIAESSSVTRLEDTVNYAEVYETIRQEVETGCDLLETLAQNCLNSLEKQFMGVKEMEIVVRKLNPPLPGQVGSSKVTLCRQYQ